MRTFETGATRDTEEGKPDYEGFISPLVLRRYGQYMDKHRHQADGEVRSSDNWQSLFGANHKDVCIKSLLRHVVDLWLCHDGYEEAAREDVEAALCAILFNAQAYLYAILKEQYDE